MRANSLSLKGDWLKRECAYEQFGMQNKVTFYES